MKKSIFILLAMVFIFAVGSAYAASVQIVGPTEVILSDGQFSIDVIITDISPLANLDIFDFTLGMSPEAGATFVSGAGPGETNYVFEGDSFFFGADVSPSGFQINVGDLTESGNGVTVGANNLLATIVIDISGAEVGEWYTVSLLDGVFADVAGTRQDILMEPYQFQVVPIPGAALLLGSGLLGLLGIRRKMR